MLELILAAGTGFGIGVLLTYLTTTRELVKTLRDMRYKGFEPERELPEVPKLSPLWEEIRED